MRPNSTRRAAIAALAVGSLLLPAAARADWLVGTDGSRLEIKGPWTVKGKVVTFTLPNGTLGSLRLSDVDLEKSAQATAEAQAKAAAPAASLAAVKPAPAIVLRDEDVQHLNPVSLEPETAAGETAAKEEASANPVVVSAWEKGYSQLDDSVMLTGTVRNTGKAVAMGIGVVVKLYDEKGALVGTADATLNADTLQPGAATNFRAVVTGVQSFLAAKFDVTSTPVQTSTEPSETEEAPPPQ